MNANTDGWIGGPRHDLAFFFFPGLLAAGAGLLCVALPALVAPIWWLWIWLIEGPHLAATYARTYCDQEERSKRRALLLGSLACFIPGLAVWELSRISSSFSPFTPLLAVAAVYSYYHGVRQHYGVMSIYHRLGQTEERWRQTDSRYLQRMLVALFLIPLALFKPNRKLLGLPEALPQLFAGAIPVVLIALGLYTAWYISGIWARWRGGLTIKPALFTLLPVVGLGVFAVFLVGPKEPIFPHPINSEQLFLVVTFMGGITHGLEYLGIVFLANRRRYEKNGAQGFWPALGRRPIAAYGVFAALSIAHIGLNAARGVAPNLSLFDPNSDAARLFLAFYWGVFFHHYYLDQKIWRIQGNPALKEELGVFA